MHDTMTQEIANLNFSTIAALQQKRTLAFVNHFILTTVQFLNTFAKKCEQKLMRFERKLEKVEAAMVLLEARLSSIPEINSIIEAEKPKEVISEIKPKESISELLPRESILETGTKEPTIDEKSIKEELIETTDVLHSSSYPEYERFVKMVQVGVPLPAVKLKVSTEGLDPNVFDQILNK